jgi:hypothetical protein
MSTFIITKKENKSCQELLTTILLPMIGKSHLFIDIKDRDDYCYFFISKKELK